MIKLFAMILDSTLTNKISCAVSAFKMKTAVHNFKGFEQCVLEFLTAAMINGVNYLNNTSSLYLRAIFIGNFVFSVLHAALIFSIAARKK